VYMVIAPFLISVNAIRYARSHSLNCAGVAQVATQIAMQVNALAASAKVASEVSPGSGVTEPSPSKSANRL